jgi:benzodiazapine receptor
MILRYASLLGFLLVVVTAASIGSSFTAGSWYYDWLHKPAWSPAPWFLAVAWALAYVALALAGWRLWLTGHYDRFRALGWWVVMLLLAVVWQALYFGLHRPGWSLLALGLGLVTGVFAVRAFRVLSPSAAGLILLALGWLAFEWMLNLATWSLNGGPLYRYFA